MEEREERFKEFEQKMRSAGLNDASIRAFQFSYESLLAGESGTIPETTIAPVGGLPRLEDISTERHQDSALISQVAVIKLNGGLGTGMGLERAKSLLVAKNGLTFLDLIARHVLHLRKQHAVPLRFLLMNSFSTSPDTLDFLKRYPELGDPRSLELMQSQVPKVDAQTLRPVSWPANPQLEWCPPGHGDIYPSLLGSSILDRMLAEQVKYLFVSNSDNLGASLDLNLLRYFAESGKGFLMEVAERTQSDRKGGHIAQRGPKLLLRESAQCLAEDLDAFQDITRHQYFNTNNLWIRLQSLKALLDRHHGFVPLPLIKNAKTVDPRDKASLAVFQLETAMGAAIECFDNAGAIVVPRTRFAPVKTTADLLALRSDAFELTPDWRVAPATKGNNAPAIDLASDHYKLVDQLDDMLSGGVPSLRDCHELVVRGPVRFNAKNIFRGKVTLINRSAVPHALPEGVYTDQVVEL
jgi:UDP-N-acetylglucosamine pyrophosphorylase